MSKNLTIALSGIPYGPGSSDLYWDDVNNRLGIGTTAPSEKLDVDGVIRSRGKLVSSSWYNLTLQNQAADNSAYIRNVGASGSSDLSLDDKVYIKESGNVGIGTSAPGNLLHIDTAATDVDVLRFNTGGGTFVAGHKDSGDSIFIRTGGASLSFGAGSVVDHLYIKHTSGNVGIGTIAPSELLTVAGSISARDNVFSDSVLNVKAHGAVGDGTTDDTTAIQNAIDELDGNGFGGMLYFPVGTYKITDVLTIEGYGADDAIHIVGSGKVSSIIKQTTSGKGVLEICGRQHSVRDLKLQGVDGDPSAVVLAFGENYIAVSSITHTGGVATVTTSVAHGYSSATNITIEGSTDTEFNGLFEITVTSTTQFTYVVTSGETSADGTIRAINGNGNDCNNNTVSNVSIKYGADGISMKDCWGIYVTECHISTPSRSCIKIKNAQFNVFQNVSMDGVGNDGNGYEEASIWYVPDMTSGGVGTNTFKHINHNGSKAPIVKFDGVAPNWEIFDDIYDDNGAGFFPSSDTSNLSGIGNRFVDMYSNPRKPAWLMHTIDPFYWRWMNTETHSGDRLTVHSNNVIVNDHSTIGNLAANGDFARRTSTTRVDDWVYWNSYAGVEIDVTAGPPVTGAAASGSPHSAHLISSTADSAPYATFSQRGSMDDEIVNSTNNVLDPNQTYLVSAKIKIIDNVDTATKLRVMRAFYNGPQFSVNWTHPDVSYTDGWQTLTCMTSGLSANTGVVGDLYLDHDGGAAEAYFADFKIVEAKSANIKICTIHIPATIAANEFELPVFSPNVPVVVMETFIIPSVDITGANTNYMKLQFRSKGSNGTDDTLMSDTDFTSGITASDWAKYRIGQVIPAGTRSGGVIKNGKTDLAIDEVVTIKKVAVGSGMVTPAMTVGITYFIP